MPSGRFFGAPSGRMFQRVKVPNPPDVLITDGLRGAEAACLEAWPGTRIHRHLVHVQRNTRTDLTSRPRLQAGRELKNCPAC